MFRLVGDHVITQNNICHPSVKTDSIAVGDWSFDEHMTGKYAVPDGKGAYTVMLEGNFWPSIAAGCGSSAADGGTEGSPSASADANSVRALGWGADDGYDVPYAALVPKRGQGGNLLVPVCLSASAVAYSSTRIESMFMYVGTAAGVAAAQVVNGLASTVQDVNVTKVQQILTGTPFFNPPLTPL